MILFWIVFNKIQCQITKLRQNQHSFSERTEMPKFRIIFVVAKSNIFFSYKIALLLLELTYFFPQERRRRWRDTSNDGLLGHICNPFCSALQAWPSPVLTTKFCHLKGIEQTRRGRRSQEGRLFQLFLFYGLTLVHSV